VRHQQNQLAIPEWSRWATQHIHKQQHSSALGNWVYIKNAAGKVVGRYAYWADDECSKLDIRFAGQSNNISGNHTRSDGSAFRDLALTPLTNSLNSSGNLTSSNLANLLAFTSNALQALPLTIQNAQYAITNTGNLSSTQWQSLKPFVTILLPPRRPLARWQKTDQPQRPRHQHNQRD
jgi:hypothetical protein